jgi:hypothetical protein
MAQNQFRILTDEHIVGAIVQQLRHNGVDVARVEDTIGKGTPDPDMIQYAHENGYCLLTHDEQILGHVKNRTNEGLEHSGLFVAGNHLHGNKGIGRIVEEITFWHNAIINNAANVEDDVYNQVNYIT